MRTPFPAELRRGPKPKNLPTEKYCPQCQRTLPATEEYFYRNKWGTRGGFRGWCKECESADRKFKGKDYRGQVETHALDVLRIFRTYLSAAFKIKRSDFAGQMVVCQVIYHYCLHTEYGGLDIDRIIGVKR